MRPADTLRIEPPDIPEGWDPRSSRQGGHGIKTYSFHPFDEVISALQKSVRRGWACDAVHWATEAFLAGEAGTRSNLWNRLITISVEDVGAAEPWLFPLVVRQAAEARDDKYTAGACACLLARARKTRLNDWAAISPPEPRPEGWGSEMPRIAASRGSAEDLTAALADALRAHDFEGALLHIRLLRYHPGALEIPLGRRRKPEYGIWRAFRAVVGEDSAYLRACEGLTLSPNWRPGKEPVGKTLLVYVHAAVLWCRVAGGWAAAEESARNRAAANARLDAARAEIGSLVDACEARAAPLGIPDVALDMHTTKGRSLRRGLSHFMEVGSVLTNEAEEWREISADYRSRFLASL